VEGGQYSSEVFPSVSVLSLFPSGTAVQIARDLAVRSACDFAVRAARGIAGRGAMGVAVWAARGTVVRPAMDIALRVAIGLLEQGLWLEARYLQFPTVLFSRWMRQHESSILAEALGEGLA
jgi:hypothetical protein